MADDQSNSRERPSAEEAKQIAGQDEGQSEVADTTDTKAFSDCDWQDFFPFEEPYTQQIQAIEEYLDVLGENGFYTLNRRNTTAFRPWTRAVTQ